MSLALEYQLHPIAECFVSVLLSAVVFVSVLLSAVVLLCLEPEARRVGAANHAVQPGQDRCFRTVDAGARHRGRGGWLPSHATADIAGPRLHLCVAHPQGP